MLQFAQDDGFPQQICKNCILELNDAFNFSLKCERNDKLLKQCIVIDNKNVNNSVIEEKIEDNIFEDSDNKEINVSDDVGDNDYEDDNSYDEIKIKQSVKRKKQKRIKIMRNVGKSPPSSCKSCDIIFKVNLKLM